MANPSLLDDDYMAAALELAKRGAGWVNPNPMVGCLIVKDGEILGAGYHTRFGAPHAEREALADCVRRGRDTVGATAYVTLEPCSHTGKTPPCCDALIDAGIARVVVGSNDPNPFGGRSRDSASCRCWYRCEDRGSIAALRCAQCCIFSLHHNTNAVCCGEVRLHARWQDRHA